jgi:hypothetical protein
MSKTVKQWILPGVVVIGILTLLMGCKPETRQSSLARPEAGQSPLAMPAMGQSPLATPEEVGMPSQDNGRPRTVPPPGTPNPTPTPLPDRGVRAEVAQEVVAQASTSSPLGTRFRFFGPATDGKTVVGTISQDNKDRVAAIDLTSGKSQILSDAQNQINEPRVSGRYVVWTTLHELYFYDLENGQSGQLDSGLATQHARISGNVVVWEHGHNTGLEIRGHDFLTNKDFLIGTQPHAAAPEISGDWVVYESGVEQPSYAGLRVVNIKTQEDIHLGEVFLGTQESPYVPPLYAIDVPWVAWSRGGQSPSPALYLYNLNTRTTYTVTIPSWGESLSKPSPITINPMYLTMSNRVVIFSGYYQDIGYDIERQVFFSLPTNAPYGFDKLGWSIAGDQLVWVLSSGPYGQEESHIYTTQIIRDK